jgi:hypothetical protein
MTIFENLPPQFKIVLSGVGNVCLTLPSVQFEDIWGPRKALLVSLKMKESGQVRSRCPSMFWTPIWTNGAA